MLLIIIGIIIAAVVFFKYCENIGAQMDEYQNREPEWNPPLPKPQYPKDLSNLPNKSPCCCANCQYLYSGTKTEYWYDDRERCGKSKTTRYQNWCPVHKANVETEVGYRLTEIHHCGMFHKK